MRECVCVCVWVGGCVCECVCVWVGGCVITQSSSDGNYSVLFAGLVRFSTDLGG